jgi:hypothetical protein
MILWIFQSKTRKDIAEIERKIEEMKGFAPTAARFHPVQVRYHPTEEGFHPIQEGFHPAQERYHPTQERFHPQRNKYLACVKLSVHPHYAIYPLSLHPQTNTSANAYTREILTGFVFC